MHLQRCQEDDKHHKRAKPIENQPRKPQVNKSFSSTSNNPLNQLHVFALHTWLDSHLRNHASLNARSKRSFKTSAERQY